MRITIKTDSYNSRRDGAPWIYLVGAWPVGSQRPEVARWGAFLGERGYGRGGAASQLEIEAEPGDIVRWGQNDLRRNNHTYRQYGLVSGVGRVDEISDTFARELALLSREERLRKNEETDHRDAILEDQERAKKTEVVA